MEMFLISVKQQSCDQVWGHELEPLFTEPPVQTGTRSAICCTLTGHSPRGGMEWTSERRLILFLWVMRCKNEQHVIKRAGCSAGRGKGYLRRSISCSCRRAGRRRAPPALKHGAAVAMCPGALCWSDGGPGLSRWVGHLVFYQQNKLRTFKQC